MIKGVELCWKKEETTCIFDIGKVPSGLLQLGMCNWGYEAGVGGTRCHINSDKTCQTWIYFIYKIRIATIFNQSIYQQTNQLRKTSASVIFFICSSAFGSCQASQFQTASCLFLNSSFELLKGPFRFEAKGGCAGNQIREEGG